MTASTKVTKEMHNDCSDVFSGIGYLNITFSLQVKGGVKHTMLCLDAWHTHYKTHSRKNWSTCNNSK